MLYKSTYESPLGEITLLVEYALIRGLWFSDQKYMGAGYNLNEIKEEENETILKVKNWLDLYFKGDNPSIEGLNLAPETTAYRNRVLDILKMVPYGHLITYKEINEQLSNDSIRSASSARAVGGAVGHNPISIIIPCHRVVGSNGDLTGYAGGIDRKIKLLKLEGIEITTNK